MRALKSVIAVLGMLLLGCTSEGLQVPLPRSDEARGLLVLVTDTEGNPHSGRGSIVLTTIDTRTGDICSFLLPAGLVGGVALATDRHAIAVWSEGGPIDLIEVGRQDCGTLVEPIQDRLDPGPATQVLFAPETAAYWRVQLVRAGTSVELRETAGGQPRIAIEIEEAEQALSARQELLLRSHSGDAILVGSDGGVATEQRPSNDAQLVGATGDVTIWLQDGRRTLSVIQRSKDAQRQLRAPDGRFWVAANRLPIPSHSAPPDAVNRRGDRVLIGLSSATGRSEHISELLVLELTTGNEIDRHPINDWFVGAHWGGGSEPVIVTQTTAGGEGFTVHDVATGQRHELPIHAAIQAAG